jgi:hypothetical protein
VVLKRCCLGRGRAEVAVDPRRVGTAVHSLTS